MVGAVIGGEIDVSFVDELRAIGREAGLDALGVAGPEPFDDTRRLLESRRAAGLAASMQFTYRNPVRSTSPERALPGARSLVVGARHYRHQDVPAPAGGASGRVARYARDDHYGALRQGLGAVADRLRTEGWRTRVLCDDNALVDRAAAYRAGLGWYGKSSNLLLEGRGSWFVLGSVVTDAPLPPATRTVPDGCGSCTRCVDACPTGAIVEPGVVDARRCLAWLVQAEGPFPVQFRVALGDRIYGCDDCQEVCPPNRRDDRRELTAGTEQEEAWVDLVDLLASDDKELLDRHGRWYVPRRQPRYLRRNALVALANVGDGGSPRVKAALVAALGDEDGLVRGHAAWAAFRLGCGDLAERLLAGDADPDVNAELDVARAAGPRPLVTTLLVTNDFPPKVGGIQSYLWELWRRLPPSETAVLTSAHPDAAAFDAAARPLRIVRSTSSVLLPTPGLRGHINRLASEIDAGLVLLDPALPLGLLGPRLARPYGLVLHGAEVTVPGRLPVSRQVLGGLLRGAAHVLSAGAYPLAEAERAAGRALPATVIPPGVDPSAFRPIDPDARDGIRERFGLPAEGRLVVSLSRLVPRKGMDVLIGAAALLILSRPDLTVAIAGSGRDQGRLERLAKTTGAPVRLLGRVAEQDKRDLYGCADVFAMLCRNRWVGLEQEGFGIVFLEAAASGLAVVAGESGGADEAVEDGVTGIVVREPGDPRFVAEALASLLDDPERRERMGMAGRVRAEEHFAWGRLAAELREALARQVGPGGLG